MVIKRRAAAAYFGRFELFLERLKTLGRAVNPEFSPVAQRIGLVSHPALVHRLPVNAVALEIVERAHTLVDGYLMEVRAAQP